MTAPSDEMPTKDEIEARLRAGISRQLDVDAAGIRGDSSFIDDLGVDSREQAELLLMVEEEFEIDVLEEDMRTLTTVQDAVDFIAEQIARQA